VIPARADRVPEAGADVDVLAFELVRAPHRRVDPLGDRRRAFRPGDVVAQDGELVLADPGHGVAGAERAEHPLGHGHQEPVAGVPSIAVVHQAESVEIEEEHGDPGGPPA
jgi:hypothetical protein